ncbi:uncharacterized protein [Anabrus simplex]|uniref:uncharacterized protein n=1 Tax=Anabrus simplex TaxID=316456 RepID=UPI0035A2A1C7
MDSLIALALLCEEAENEDNERKRDRRRFWVHEINLTREPKGEYATLFEYVLRDEDKFRQYFRMSVLKFQQLFQMAEPHLTKQFTRFRAPVPPLLRMIVCLRFLATGDSLRTISFSYRLGYSTVVKIVNETCEILSNILHPIYMPKPTEEKWKSIEKGFQERWQFPNCIGSIDGKHVIIQAPNKSGSLFYNYKGTFSIVLLALVDSNYKFIAVDIGAFGSNSDGGIFQNSNLGKALETKNLNIPENKNLPGTDIHLPHVIVGDEAFPLKTYLMRPYSKAQLNGNKEKKIFNYRLSRARNVVENTFGIMAQKFRLYQRRLQQTPQHVKNIVFTTCVLHNFLRDDVISFVEEESLNSTSAALQRLHFTGGNATSVAMEVRDEFKTYFNAVGCVPWQNDIINRGRLNTN